MNYKRERMREIKMVMPSLLLIARANNLWEMLNLSLEARNTILIQWFWRMQ
jgi:hypothetical protein